MPFYEGTPEERITAQIAESGREPVLSAKPELLRRKVRWPSNHGHGPRSSEACDDGVAVVTSVSIADKYSLWVPLGTVLLGIQCVGCAEYTTVTEAESKLLDA